MSEQKPPEHANTYLLPTLPSEVGQTLPLDDEPTENLYGEILGAGVLAGSYEIEQLAFQGGFASIYRAHHIESKRPAAVKVLHRSLADSTRMIERFEQEARALNRLDHPNIVEIFELGELVDFRPFIAMEWLGGRNLAAELKARGPFSPREALAVMSELGAALQAAHDLGVVHRDLKAQNVIALPRNDWFTIKLVDFGIAKLTAPADQGTALTTKTIIGSPHTMAPEQIMCQEIDARTDIYAMGVMLYEFVTGRLPFRGSNLIEIEEMHLHASPPPPSQVAPVSQAFDQVVRRALQKDKEDRWPCVKEMVQALRAAVLEDSAGIVVPPIDGNDEDDVSVAGPGVGLYVEIRLADGADGQDDDVLDAIDDALDEVREFIDSVGLIMALETPKALLSVVPLGEHAAGRELRRTLIAQVLGLHDEVMRELAESGASGAIDVAMVVHAASVKLDSTTGQAVEGDLLSLGEWPQGWEQHGVFASKSALGGLEDQLLRTLLASATDLYKITARD